MGALDDSADNLRPAHRYTLIHSSALGRPDSERVTLEVLDRLEAVQH